MIICSSYQKARSVDRLGERAVNMFSISRSTPAWFKIDGTVREAVPKSWDLIRGSKDGRIAWEEYRRRYLADLSSGELVRQVLEASEDCDDLYLLCWCRDVSVCHRSIVADVLRNTGLEVVLE